MLLTGKKGQLKKEILSVAMMTNFGLALKLPTSHFFIHERVESAFLTNTPTAATTESQTVHGLQLAMLSKPKVSVS